MLTDFHETVETGMLPCLHGISDFSLAVIDNPLGISTICISTGRSRISVYSIFFSALHKLVILRMQNKILSYCVGLKPSND